MLISTPTQKRNWTKRVGTAVGSLRPKRNPTRTNPTSLTYSSRRFVKIAPKNYRCKMLPVAFYLAVNQINFINGIIRMSFNNLKFLILSLVIPVISLGILTACVKDNTEAATANKSPPSTPNMIINVKRQAGNCPETIGIWTFMLPFEGGAEHTAVADMRNAKLVASDKKFVEYEATLRNSHTSCVGSAQSEGPLVYNFQFRNGKVYFRLDLNKSTLNTEITYQGTGGYRPYVRWIAAE